MAQIKINKDRFVEGKFTVKQRLVEDEKGNGRMPPKICYEKWLKKEFL